MPEQTALCAALLRDALRVLKSEPQTQREEYDYQHTLAWVTTPTLGRISLEVVCGVLGFDLGRVQSKLIAHAFISSEDGHCYSDDRDNEAEHGNELLPSPALAINSITL